MAPPFKGHRDPMMTRPPVEVGQIIRARAKRAGIPYGDLIAAILSEYVGLSHLCPMPNIDHTDPLALPMEELQLPRTA
jgi:hypothetical protein